MSRLPSFSAWASSTLVAALALTGCQSPPVSANRALLPDATPTDCGEPRHTLPPQLPHPPTGAAMVGEPAPLALQGQMSIKLEAFGDQAAKGVSLGFFFNGHAQAGDLDLMTLLGSAVAHLHWQPGAVELVDGQGARQYATLGELSQAALGEALPLDTLVHWMQGRADPSLPALAGETPQTFEQLGWQIDVRDYANKKLTASRAASPVARGVRIKVYLDR